MNKNRILIITIILLLLLTPILLLLKFHNSTEDTIFPDKLNIISSNNIVGYAYQRQLIWQYPTSDTTISGIGTSFQNPETNVFNIKNFSKNIQFLESIDNLHVDLSTFNSKYINEISNIYLEVFNEQNENVISKEIELIDHKLELIINNIVSKGTYYGELNINFKYHSFVKYNFKFKL